MTLVERILKLLQSVDRMTLQEMRNVTNQPAAAVANAVQNLTIKGQIERVSLATYRAKRKAEPPQLPQSKFESSIRPLTREELMRGRA